MEYFNQNQGFINQLERQKENIDNMLAKFSQPSPIQNIITTNLDFEAKFLKDDEEVSNIPITRRTLFIDEKNKKISIKELDGTISKEYEIVIPLDEKDKKILELERKLKEMEIKYEPSKFIQSDDKCKEPSTNDDQHDESGTKTNV